MIQVKLGYLKPASATDPRGTIGWYPGMTETQAWEAGRMFWKLDPARAHRQNELQVIAPDQTVLCVGRIDSLKRHGDRYEIVGTLLHGDPRVGKKTQFEHAPRRTFIYV
jgi:hypothetical protein